MMLGPHPDKDHLVAEEQRKDGRHTGGLLVLTHDTHTEVDIFWSGQHRPWAGDLHTNQESGCLAK